MNKMGRVQSLVGPHRLAHSGRSICTTTDVLSSASQVGLKPLESNAVDAETSLESLQQDVMVDRVECSRRGQLDMGVGSSKSTWVDLGLSSPVKSVG